MTPAKLLAKVLAAVPATFTGQITLVLHVHRGSVGRVEVKR